MMKFFLLFISFFFFYSSLSAAEIQWRSIYPRWHVGDSSLFLSEDKTNYIFRPSKISNMSLPDVKLYTDIKLKKNYSYHVKFDIKKKHSTQYMFGFAFFTKDGIRHKFIFIKNKNKLFLAEDWREKKKHSFIVKEHTELLKLLKEKNNLLSYYPKQNRLMLNTVSVSVRPVENNMRSFFILAENSNTVFTDFFIRSKNKLILSEQFNSHNFKWLNPILGLYKEQKGGPLGP